MKVVAFHGFLLTAYLPLLVLGIGSIANQIDTSVLPASPSSRLDSISSPSFCPSRTVNYLTHTLPQQCLRTSRPLSNATSMQWQTAGSVITLGGPPEKENPRQDQQETFKSEERGNRTTIAHESRDTQSSTDVSASTATETAAAAHSNDAPPSLDIDSDSPLDNANFLSFEEWKKQSMEKAGQSPESVGQSRSGGNNNEGRHRPGINNDLDSFGEDQEIDLDFGGFGNPSSDQAANPPITTGSDGGQTTVAATSRSKDAGKTCKERFNYASFDCAATVLKTNPKAKSASSVLIENKDSYMLNECSQDNKFIIVELCNDILIDTVVLANFEFFSSMFRTFRLAVSDRYPVKMERWRELGTFEARNSREVQAFLVENPLIWARYLRIEFLEHYGNEYYCPVSLVRVHGTTMLEEYRHQEEAARDEDLAIEDVADDVVRAEETKGREEDFKKQEELQAPISEQGDKKIETFPTESILQSSNISSLLAGTESSNSNTGVSNDAFTPSTSTTNLPPSAADTPSAIVFERDPVPTCANPANPPDESTASAGQKATDVTSTSTLAGANQTASEQASSSTTESSLSVSEASNVTQPHYNVSSTNTTLTGTQSAANTSIPSKSSTISPSQNTTRPGPALNPAPGSSPPTQESFFKSVHKRLQTLESNSTLSLQYIESQSRILRDAFALVQKKQLTKTEDFLRNLNTTVVSELVGFRQQYDQLWQSTVIELSESRERSRQELEEVMLRLRLLADEVVWQKRVGMVQGLLVLVCLGIVMFARGGIGAAGSGLETPGGGGMRNKGRRLRMRLPLPWESPERSPESALRGRWNLAKTFVSEESATVSRAVSDGEGEAGMSDGSGDERSVRGGKGGGTDGLLTPTDFSRPTTAGRSESPEPPLQTRLAPKETQSSPATPSGSRDLHDGSQGWEEAVREVTDGRDEEGGENEEQQLEGRKERSEAAKG